MKGEDEREVHIPVAPQKEQGEVVIRIELSTQVMSSVQEVTVNILPEGSVVHRYVWAYTILIYMSFCSAGSKFLVELRAWTRCIASFFLSTYGNCFVS